jgi:hypothetical protein
MKTLSLIERARERFLAWRQFRHESSQVNGISHELLKLYGKITAEHTQSGDRERFIKLIMMRGRCDEAAAYEVLRSAEDSYAAWPLERELTLCDVIHYLAVREFSVKQVGESWTGVNIAASVKAIVPRKLCRIRLKQPYLSERRRNSRDIQG